MISYSEAFELAQAGFPQPEIDVGQMWYNHGADLCWIAKRWDAEHFTVCKDNGQVMIRVPINKKYLVFVPDKNTVDAFRLENAKSASIH
jgi:hypothetical protein